MCCGLRFAEGVKGEAIEVLKKYIIGRREASAHTYVVMTFVEDNASYKCKEFIALIRELKLGSVMRTKANRNINHGGWGGTGGNQLCVVVLTPDHQAMTDWYQKFVDPAYKLKRIPF